ncbi:MAG: IS21 family transposase [Desulfovermiculus sp.]
MIDYEFYARIKHYHNQKGLTPAQIADELQLDRRTVIKWLEAKQFCPRKSGSRSSKLDTFKDTIVRMLEAHPYTAVQVLRSIREQGYTGGYSILTEYISKVRPRRSRAFLTLAFAPGECAQVDWGSYGSIQIGSSRRRLSFFVMVLCYSRMMYLEFTVSQSMEHFLACHQNAFDAFGAVPGKIMVDNLKCAVLKHPLGQKPLLNPKYIDFARHWGFGITACGVRKPHEKGRVENAIGYVKKNFLAGLELPDYRAINHYARHWCSSTANVRIHAQTGKKPVDMLSEEKEHLLPLPVNTYDIGVITQTRASSQFRINLESNRYSVPARYAGKRLTLKTYPDRLCVYDSNTLVARHVRSFDKKQDFEDPDHVQELLVQRRAARGQQMFARFLALSPRAQDYYDELKKKRLNTSHHVQKIVALSEIYSIEAVARAMDDAFTYSAFSCEYIANILEQRARIMPVPGALHLTRREDLLDIEVKEPDLSIYDKPREKKP